MASPRRRRRLRLRLVPLLAAVAGAALLCAAGVGLLLAPAHAPAKPAPDATNQSRLDKTVRYVQRMQNKDGGYSIVPGRPSDVGFSAWMAFAVAAYDINPREQFLPNGWDVVTYLQRNAGALSVTTDYERTLLVTVAAGTDPRSFGGVDLIERLASRRLPDGSFTHIAGGTAPGVNDTIFAILSLALVDDPLAKSMVQGALGATLRHQNDDGSWPSFQVGAPGDADMTGAAIQALNAIGQHDTEAESRALRWLSDNQHADGGIGAVAGADSNASSSAWVAQGLWAAGIDPRGWTRGGNSVLDYLASMQQEDGSVMQSASAGLLNPGFVTAYCAPAFAGQPLPIPPVPFTGRYPNPTDDDPPPVNDGDGTGGGSGGFDAAKGGGVIAGGGGKGAANFSRPRRGSRGRTAGGVRRVRQRRTARRTRTDRRDTSPAPEVVRGEQEATAPERRDRRDERDRRERPRTPTAAPNEQETMTASSTGDHDDGAVASGGAADRAGGGGSADLSGDTARAGGSRGRANSGGAVGGPLRSQADAAAEDAEVSGVVVGGDGASSAARGDDRAAAYGLRGAQAGGETAPWVAVGLGGALLLCAGGGGLFEWRRPEITA
ncbi:prenyltransferase/squalene oxidase repeat-containing protein [Conexibacter woesei]|uniref:Prenyltransferase alpha-alpha toroid domain-containing protein n=1 Tax=Conexibacter woesei (strain DSM 14684 / CCUG 47730 / CIP 108061 / JCM 11494 / NBRC 100937 / ID131577) TaxID=469383 RepID=D3F177_CONWI|nr:prenyltransferase/squalene oxidase repeat-containing protein [Conexibacter woesei]ADB50153.1 hypothetical protein Cwoe_1726 [Conexibacter woesei DSM 14684]